MLSAQDLSGLTGRTMVGRDGGKIGKIADVYDAGDGPDDHFATVATGLFGRSASFVPLAQAELRGDDVVVPYDKDLVKNAPRVDDDEALTAQEEDRLYQHFGLAGPATAHTAAAPGAPATPATSGSTALTAADAAADDADDVLVHEEQGVGEQRREAGHARLVKRVTSELQTATVPVSHDEVRVTLEPVTDAEPAPSGAALSEEVREVVLEEEVPVVDKQVVPVEEVHVDEETVPEQGQVTETVGEEHLAADVDPSATDDAGRR